MTWRARVKKDMNNLDYELSWYIIKVKDEFTWIITKIDSFVRIADSNILGFRF